MSRNGNLDHISYQLECMREVQENCNKIPQDIHDKMHPRRNNDNAIIIEIEKELTEANEMLAEAMEHERKAVEEAEERMRGGQRPLTDPFYEDRVINQPLLVYWKRLIENHIKDEKFTSLDHAIVYLVDKYPKRKEG